ncbi:hypothetical protein JL721_4289 [Aureococcus anophagefferens]|nr:hypothetical protein JL721_4289 [Aureococcus anophagefferens]
MGCLALAWLLAACAPPARRRATAGSSGSSGSSSGSSGSRSGSARSAATGATRRRCRRATARRCAGAGTSSSTRADDAQQLRRDAQEHAQRVHGVAAPQHAEDRDADAIVWHEGDLEPADATALDGAANVRFCLLTEETGWGSPPWLPVMPENKFSAGRYMIRFYAVTIWRTLRRLGYEWVMRMDDDSFVLSPVAYNVFDDMRDAGLLYATAASGSARRSSATSSRASRPTATRASSATRRSGGEGS